MKLDLPVPGRRAALVTSWLHQAVLLDGRRIAWRLLPTLASTWTVQLGEQRLEVTHRPRCELRLDGHALAAESEALARHLRRHTLVARAGIALLLPALAFGVLVWFGWFANLADPWLTATHPGGACAFHPTYDSDTCSRVINPELTEAHALAGRLRAEQLSAADVEARLVELLAEWGATRRGLMGAAIVYAANGQPVEAAQLLERADALAPIKGVALPAEIATAAGRCDLARRFALRDLADPLGCYSSRIVCAGLTACEGAGREVREVLTTPEPVNTASIQADALNLEVRSWLLDGDVAKAREAAAKLTPPGRLWNLEAALLAASAGDEAALSAALDGLLERSPCLEEALRHDRLGALLLRNPAAARRLGAACPGRLASFESLLARAHR